MGGSKVLLPSPHAWQTSGLLLTSLSSSTMFVFMGSVDRRDAMWTFIIVSSKNSKRDVPSTWRGGERGVVKVMGAWVTVKGRWGTEPCGARRPPMAVACLLAPDTAARDAPTCS